MLERLNRSIRWAWQTLLRYALKFGVVGLVGYAVDVALFNALRLGLVGHDHFWQGPLGAKIISVTVSTLVTWFGNRYWTFREHRRKNFVLELVEFSVVSVGGLLIALLCLWISHYVLGFTSLLADNISTNIIGLFLGTAFRFLMYRYWVYGHHRKDGLTARQHKAEAAALAIFEDEQTASVTAEIPTIRPSRPADDPA
ncbi:GtrA family protein [Protaetiibacter larvae]|uniref:GtrA family protein n=1 Tax=Protaetiibacter larvae TaxID=2592654 RepID=A0A5C1Y3Q8_9MICO|nr:GtrA family protein [Protaetiibacter larvae]QEO08643.1 GtrA family protein [Protaetiibacter larvae]